MNTNLQKIAEECGIASPDSFGLTISGMSVTTLERFARLVRQDERERCIKTFGDSLNWNGEKTK